MIIRLQNLARWNNHGEGSKDAKSCTTGRQIRLPSPQASLFHAAYAFRITWSARHRNALTEKAWEDAVTSLRRK